MPVVWSKDNNPHWPLPRDYKDLTWEGQREARVNAASLRGRPDLDVAAWAFFREYYLLSLPPGMWYKHGAVKSPDCHYQWVYNWGKYPLSVTAAPRSAAKSTIVRENILRKIVTRPYWESIIFLAKQSFVSDSLELFMNQIEHNPRLVEDFGKMRPPRTSGVWNHSQIKITNGAMVTGMPIKGASLGKRPHEIWFDDVEKDDSLVLSPSDLINAFKGMLFNVVFPMAEEGVAIRIIGTLLSRRTFLYWMQTTDDPRVKDYWYRILLAVKMTRDDGTQYNLWEEKMGEEWQEKQKLMMGSAAYGAQYLNDPGTESEKILRMVPELHGYAVENRDLAYEHDPLASDATLVSYQITGLDPDKKPITSKLSRPLGTTVSTMRRYLTVDWAPTASESSDYSAIHVLGWENSQDYRDVLWSLDLDVGKYSKDMLIRRIYQMAAKWQCTLIGVEAYPVQMEFYERLAHDLPSLFQKEGFCPRMVPLKFPPKLSKPQKIMGLEWRFNQYRIKLPMDRNEDLAYSPGHEAGLLYQIDNFTEDLALLRYDDALDSLAMHQAFGKPRTPVEAEIKKVDEPNKLLAEGECYYDSGIPILSGMNASDISPEAWAAMQDKRYEPIQEEMDQDREDWEAIQSWFPVINDKGEIYVGE